ncbi:MAG: HPr family phosphocarrier protein [Planctomycetota bacterium]
MPESTWTDGMSSTNLRVERDVTVPNKQGLHARPVLRFVDLASKFDSSIRVCKRDTSVDGKSPMEMMLLEATQGTVLTIVAEGEDCEKAVVELSRLVSEGFGEQ